MRFRLSATAIFDVAVESGLSFSFVDENAVFVSGCTADVSIRINYMQHMLALLFFCASERACVCVCLCNPFVS